MSKSVNRVILLGNVGNQPESKFTPSGVAVTKFTLATNEKYKDKSGEWVDRAEWTQITVWAKLAEIVNQYVTKGSKLYVEGKLQTESWSDKESGEKKYRTGVTANEIVLLDSKPQATAASGDEGEPF